MASSVSSSINTYAGIEKYSPNFQLLGQVLNAKQTQLNTNRNKLQDFRNQLGALDVVKDEDRAYLDQRLDQVTDISNKYANLDLSSDALTNSLIGNMGQVFDENVKAALTGTKILRNEQAEWTKMKEKDPKLYSDSNYAYAMQGANRWMNDKQTGTRYNGGGGFIEYASAEDEMNKNMPDAIKAATHKRQRPIAGPAGGVGGIITEEFVDRTELQNILLSKLDSKNLRQLDIDAWAKYSQKPEELLRSDYDNYTKPQIEEADSKIESLEAAIANTSNKDAKATYQNSLDAYKKQKDAFENELSFDNFVKTHGKEGVYSSLHKNQVMDRFLDAYSRDPEVVDIEVNAIEAANIEIQLKREAAAETRRGHEESRRHNIAQENTERYKAGLADADGNKIDPTKNIGTLPGGKLEIEPKYETGSVFSKLNEDYTTSAEKVKLALTKMGVPEQEAKWFIEGKRYAAMAKTGDIAGLTNIVIGKDKKQYKVSKEFREGMSDIHINHMDSPVLNKAFKDIDAMVTIAQKSIGRGFSINEIAYKDIPDFTVKARYNKSGKVVFDVNSSGFTNNGNENTGQKYQNYYTALLEKKSKLKKGEKLSKIEEVNLQLYGNLHLLNDGNITDAQRTFVKQRIVAQLSDLKVDGKQYAKINLNTKTGIGSIMPNTRTKIEKWNDTWMTEITAKDVSKDVRSDEQARNMLKRAKEGLAQVESGKVTFFGIGVSKEEAKADYLAAIKLYEPMVAKANIDVKGHIENGFKQIEKTIENNIIEQTKLVSGREIILPKNKSTLATWERLAAASKISTESTENLVITPDIVNGEPTGKVYVTKRGVKLDKKTAIKQEMSTTELRELGILDIDLNKHKYNATKAEFAPTLKLGNGSYHGSMNTGISPVYRNGLLEITAQNPEIADVTNKILQEYKEGMYRVEYTPISGNYYARVVVSGGKNDGDDVIEGYQENIGSLITDDQVSDMLEQPKVYTDKIIYNMLKRYKEAIVGNNY